MFFSITNKVKSNYNKNYQLGSFVVNTDSGWSIQEQDMWSVLYKGYADCNSLENILDQILEESEPSYLGNFCVIAYNRISDSIKIKTDRYRDFPVYLNTNEVTNLVGNEKTAWSDSLVEIFSDLTIKETKFDIIGSVNSSTMPADQVIEQITNILDQRTQQFLSHNTRPIRVFLSGGVDSLLVYSFLQKYTDDYTFVKSRHVDYDYFWTQNQGVIQSHWAYTQIHHWTDPCVLTSGAPGDEYTLRSPATGHLYLQYHNLDTQTELQKRPDCLHHYYFSQSKHMKIFETVNNYSINNDSQLIHYLCNIVVNDWQHHHLGNTLTWTPLRDLEIYKLILRLPVEDALDQFFNSGISCQIIERNLPGGTKLIADQKNNSNPMKNLAEFLQLPR
jgi:hypothetical protein